MKNFKGTFTAIICPFQDNKVDLISLKKLVQKQIEEGVSGFVVHGTTGESPTLSKSEKKEVFDFIKKHVPAGTPLIVGTGTNSTQESIANSKEAESWGADALLLVVPYYNKPPQRGLEAHFWAIAEATEKPILLYNVPGRTITKLELETIQKLSRHPRIIGIKEASGDIEFAKKIRELCGPEFLMLSGDDVTYDDFMAAGGDGVISVASHLIPKAFVSRTVGKHKNLVEFLFVEANPIPLKYALYKMGLIQSPECRPPLDTLAKEYREKMETFLKSEGLV